MNVRSVLILVCCVLLCVVSPAQGKTKTHAPPGNSGVDEYLEVVPGGGGDRPARKLKGSTGRLSPKSRADLRAFGPEGRATAYLAERTADPAPGGRAVRAGKSLEGAGTAGDGSDDGRVAAALSRIAGLGAGFTSLLLLMLVGGVVLAVRRGRTPSEP